MCCRDRTCYRACSSIVEVPLPRHGCVSGSTCHLIRYPCKPMPEKDGGFVGRCFARTFTDLFRFHCFQVRAMPSILNNAVLFLDRPNGRLPIFSKTRLPYKSFRANRTPKVPLGDVVFEILTATRNQEWKCTEQQGNGLDFRNLFLDTGLFPSISQLIPIVKRQELTLVLLPDLMLATRGKPEHHELNSLADVKCLLV